MAEQPRGSLSFRRIVDAVKEHRHELVPRREQRYKAIKEFVGHNYRDDWAGEPYDDADKRPINLLELAIGIHLRHLAPENPRALVTTKFDHLKPGARNLGLALDQVSQQIHLEQTLRRAVLDAMFMMGCVKTGLDVTGQVAGNPYQNSIPFVRLVDMDDFVIDTNAKTIEGVSFIGDRSRVSLDQVTKNPAFDPNLTAKLHPSRKRIYDDEGGESAESISGRMRYDQDELVDKIDLQDLWLPDYNLMLTWAADQPDLGPLRVQPWKGAPGGPYQLLWFEEVPSNLMPLAPASLWLDLHTLANTIFNHVAREALQAKRIFGYQPGHEKEARNIRDAASSDLVSMRNPQAVQQFAYGGPDQVLLAFVLQLKALFYEQAGNLELLGGLGPASQTLGQDQLLSATASKRLESMQARMRAFVTQIYRQLGHYLWTGPFVNVTVNKPIPGTELSISSQLNAMTRRGSYLDYAVSIEPYSLQYRSPQERLQLLMFLMQNLIFPMMPYLQQSGIMLNAEKIIRLSGQYSNLEAEISDMLIFGGSTETQQGGGPGEAMPSPQPGTTRRIYDRVYHSQGMGQGGGQDMLRRMLLNSMGGQGTASNRMAG